jgi:hypothetical protein
MLALGLPWHGFGPLFPALGPFESLGSPNPARQSGGVCPGTMFHCQSGGILLASPGQVSLSVHKSHRFRFFVRCLTTPRSSSLTASPAPTLPPRLSSTLASHNSPLASGPAP